VCTAGDGPRRVRPRGGARVDRREVVLAVFDFRFFGGSLGVSAGEEFVEALSTAAEARIPFVLVVSSTFSVIAPEGAAAILPGVGRSPAGWAESLKLAASDAYGLGLVDGVVSQPEGRRSGRALVRQLREVLAAGVHELLAMDPAGLTRARRDRYLVSTRHLLGPLPESGVDESWELGSLPRVAANG
jgi:hypothetical protein